MNANVGKKPIRKPLRGAMIRIGITMLVASSVYLVFGLLGWFPLELETVAWNNIRIISGVAIAGCLLAAIGYGDE
jgi:hypothetical protein